MAMLTRRSEELYLHPAGALAKASYYEFSRVCGQTFTGTSDFWGKKIPSSSRSVCSLGWEGIIASNEVTLPMKAVAKLKVISNI